MINSRNIDDLTSLVRYRARNFLAACNAAGLDVLVTSTLRDHEAQAALYAQGRTKPGRIVTWALPGQSWHNWGRAFDVVPLRYGKLVWGTGGNGIDDNPADDLTDDLELWQRIGELGEAHGLEWAGRWPRDKREFPHFQFTDGQSIDRMS